MGVLFNSLLTVVPICCPPNCLLLFQVSEVLGQQGKPDTNEMKQGYCSRAVHTSDSKSIIYPCLFTGTGTAIPLNGLDVPWPDLHLTMYRNILRQHLKKSFHPRGGFTFLMLFKSVTVNTNWPLRVKKKTTKISSVKKWINKVISIK